MPGSVLSRTLQSGADVPVMVPTQVDAGSQRIILLIHDSSFSNSVCLCDSHTVAILIKALGL